VYQSIARVVNNWSHQPSDPETVCDRTIRVSHVQIDLARSVEVLRNDSRPTPSPAPALDGAAPAGLTDLLQAVQAPAVVVEHQSPLRIPSADPEGGIRNEIPARIDIACPRVDRDFLIPAHAHPSPERGLYEQACANAEVLEAAEQDAERFDRQLDPRSAVGSAAQAPQSTDQVIEIVPLEEELADPILCLRGRIQLEEYNMAQTEIPGEFVEFLDMTVVSPVQNMIREYTGQIGGYRLLDSLHGVLEVASFTHDQAMQLLRVSVEAEFVAGGARYPGRFVGKPVLERHDPLGRAEFAHQSDAVLPISRGRIHDDMVTRCCRHPSNLLGLFLPRRRCRIEETVRAFVLAVLVQDFYDHRLTSR